MEFIMEERKGDERLEGVAKFWYLGIPLDQTDGDWPAVRRNIMRATSVWGRMGTLIQKKGAYPRVEEIFYWAVVQAILLYGLEMWVLSSAM